MILDGHAAGLATVEIVLPSGTLLGRDLPHLERNILKNFSHADVTRSKRRGRRPRPGSQDEGFAGMCNEDEALAESADGGCTHEESSAGSASTVCGQGGAPAEPTQQGRALAGVQLSATVQAAYAKANLRFVSLCCPTPLLESIAIETVMAHDLSRGLDHLVMYWQHQLAKRNKATGLWRSVGSSNLMSGFVPGFTPSSCFQAEERCNRSLKEGIPTNAHKTSIDQATDFLQASSALALFRLRSSFHHMIDYMFCMGFLIIPFF